MLMQSVLVQSVLLQEVKPGHKQFGMVEGEPTHGGFAVQIPLHVIVGAKPGPRLVVQAGVSGLEIEPAMVLPKVIEELDPAQMAGTLVVVPLLNMSGFEFEQENSIWDNQNLNELGAGRADGSISEQLLHRYYTEFVADADALIDIHTGALWGYFGYAGVYQTGAVEDSQSLATALGLAHVLLGQPEDRSLAFAAARAGKAVVSAWIGGGPGLRDFRQQDIERTRNALLNAMRHLGMLPSATAKHSEISSVESVSVIAGHTVLRAGSPRGMVFMHKEKRGTQVAAGDVLGYVRHPFTGETLHEIVAPRPGVMLHAGAAWPMLHDNAILAILGDPI